MEYFRYQPEKVAVGTAYFYEKSNIDGTNRGEIVQYIASKDSLEAFKFHGGPEAALVTATMDWDRFSVRELQSYSVRADGQRTLVVTLKQEENADRLAVDGTLRSQELHQVVTMDYYPWHSYDFDFASLNMTLPHILDPVAPLALGIADFPNKRDVDQSFRFKGLVSLDIISEEERHGALCRKYRIDGPGLEHRGGEIWVDKSLQHIVDYEIDLPDEPGYASGKLRLKRIDLMNEESWREFIKAQMA